MIFLVALVAFCATFTKTIAGECEKPNEVFSKCAPDKDLTCENWVHPPVGWDTNCNTKCTCKKDHVRDPEGNCIHKHECPTPFDCKENEIFKQREDNFISCQYPNITLTLKKPYCYCREGFIYDYEVQACVKPTDCSCLGVNQIFSECVPRIPKTCNHRSNDPKYLPCFPDRKGCICKPGFVLNEEGTCVDPKTCPPTPCDVKCKSKGQTYVGCVKDVFCAIEQPPLICRKGCQCPKDTIRLPNKKCGPPEECKVCPGNAEFSLKVSQCEKTCSNLFLKEKCVDIFKPGCKCKGGFVLNAKNECIKEKDCKDTDVNCPGNLIVKKRGILKTCDNLNEEPKGDPKPGCVCPADKYFDPNLGMCVPTEECPNSGSNAECLKLDLHKEYKSCQYELPTCQDPSPSTYKATCREACVCKPGYVQVSDTNIACIKLEECPCPLNQSFQDCASTCPETCETVYQPPKPCPLICKIGCNCLPGYLLNIQNQCVKLNDCKPSEIKCSNNRIFGESGILLSCEDLAKKTPKFLSGRGCYCPIGLYYNPLIDKCVEKDECPISEQNKQCSLMDPNKEFKNCQSSSCIKTCDNPNPKICTKDCRTGCFCKEGLVQVSKIDTTCVPLNECPLKCSANETFTTCGSLCPKTCKNQYQNIMCPAVCDNIPKCQCLPGYVLNELNQCVLPTDCNPREIKCPKNQVFYELDIDKFCPGSKYILPNSIKPRAGCFCAPGYFLDEDLNTCIPQEECPSSMENKKCKSQDPNSVFKVCTPCEKTCGNQYLICTLQCKRGCVCDKGFILDHIGGKCIPKNTCPSLCPGPHAQPVECMNNCARSCSNLYNPKDPICTKICVKGCDCEKGYIKNSENECIKPEACKPFEIVCPLGMHFTNDMPKERKTCQNLNSKPDLSSTYKKGCTCDDGLVYNDKTGTCVSPKSCPEAEENKKCQKEDPNSEFSPCKPCALTCTNRNPICPFICLPGCTCQKGYILDEFGGKCIKISECPPIPDCGANATYRDHQNTCGRTCQTYNLAPFIKCAILEVPGCDCDVPYVKNNDGKCIAIEDCDPKEVKCPEGQIYKESTDPRTCEEYHSGDKKKTKGCFCKKPFVLDILNMACVSPNECPISSQQKKCQAKDPNSVFNSCIWRRPSCANLNPEVLPSCISGCECKPGFVLDKSGNCIAAARCPKVCPANSAYVNLVNECGRSCSTMFLKSIILCPKPSTPGCECLPGFVRNNAGDCILPMQCSEKETVCPPGRIYDYTTDGISCNDFLRKPNLLEIVGFKSCICPPPLALDELSQRCIHPKQCKFSPENNVCIEDDPNSEYNYCQLFGNPTCENPNPSIMSDACQSGCFCKPGFVEGPSGLCTPLDKCPGSLENIYCTGKDPNSVFDSCAPKYDGTCNVPFPSQPAFDECHRKCVCKPGFVLDEIDDGHFICFPLENCNKFTPY